MGRQATSADSLPASPSRASVDAVTDTDRARQLDAVEVDLADVELALARLEAGTYETCESCSGPLGDDVLAVTPASRRCTTCASPTG
jgi:RNA polymerase-binding transcription factor DksA